MGFTIRKANVEDASGIFELSKYFHKESTLRNNMLDNTLEKFITDYFDKKPKILFFVAEFEGKILGYSSYIHSYNVISGPSIIIPEIYIQKEYRSLGISTFLVSKIFDVAYENKTTTIKWLFSLLEEKGLQVYDKLGVSIDEDNLVLNISRDSVLKFIENYPISTKYDIHFLKTYESLNAFECIKGVAEDSEKKLQTDIYTFMDGVFSSNPKLKILVATHNNRVTGFLSFNDTYYTSGNKNLVVDTTFVLPEMRKEGVGLCLLTKLAHYMKDNNYNYGESRIHKKKIKQIKKLKEFDIFPNGNIKIARYQREEFEKLFN